jgi:polygalacturonase
MFKSNITTPRRSLTFIFLSLFFFKGVSFNDEDKEFTDKEPTTEVIQDVFTGVYFVDSKNGSDDNSGYTENSAWKSLSKVSASTFEPGDQIQFKKRERFDGHLILKSSGTEEKPIIITSYGSGDKPIITGEVGASKGGDYQEAILVENNENITFDGLEITNERASSIAGIDDEDAFGIYIYNSGSTVMRNFVFKNMTFQNVYAPKPILQSERESSFIGLEVAGVRIFSTQNKIAGEEKSIENVLMEDCYFNNLQRLGVHIKHGGGKAGIGTDETNRNSNLVFRNNEFSRTGGTCILPIRTYNCLIEDNIFDRPGDNSDPRMPNIGSAV